MTQSVEFDYETYDGRILLIQGELDKLYVSFKAFEGEKEIKKSQLKPFDLKNIEELIILIAEPETDYYDLDYREDR
jgi:hypothetical protein